MKRSSNSRVWNWARTRMAQSSSEPPSALVRLDLLADAARFLGAVPHADDLDPVALVALGPQRLAEAAGVVGDEAGGGAEDVRGRAVILFEPDDRRAGEILFEAEDVGDLGPAPRIDRLVVVADAADVAARLGEQPQPLILAGVGVLIFVDEDVVEAVAIGFEHVGVRLEDGQHVEQQVAEVAGVEGAQAVLVGGVKLLPAAVGEGFGFGGVDLGRGPAAVLPAVDHARRAGARASASRRGWRRRSAA